MDLCKLGLSKEVPISLTNSVNVADAPRLEEILSMKSCLPAERLAKVLDGQLLLCKVFVESLEIKRLGCTLLSFDFALIHDVCRQDQETNMKCAAKQWFVADSDLVLPEYIIYFSYVNEVS